MKVSSQKKEAIDRIVAYLKKDAAAEMNANAMEEKASCCRTCCRDCDSKAYVPYPWFSLNLGENCGHEAIANYCLKRFVECGDWGKSRIWHIEKYAEFCPDGLGRREK